MKTSVKNVTLCVSDVVLQVKLAFFQTVAIDIKLVFVRCANSSVSVRIFRLASEFSV